MDEVWCDDLLLCFDGRVLEVFGFASETGLRFHVRRMELEIAEPDRKGRRSVRVSHGRGGVMFDVPEADWPQVGPFLDRALAAMPDEP